MKNISVLLRGGAIFGGLVIAQAAWAQGMTPVPASAGQTGQAGAAPSGQGAPNAGQAGTGQTGGGTPPAGQIGPAGAGPAGLTPTVFPSGPAPTEKIAKITILGNKNISADTIQAVLTEKVGDVFDAQAAEKDRTAVSAMGYWATPAQIADLTDPKGGVDLTFSVVENPVIQSIEFNANTATGQPTIPAATLLALMQTKPGQVLNSNTLQSDLDTLFHPGTGYAERQGYLFTVGSSLNIVPKTGVLTVPVIETYVQAIHVTGNGKTPDTDILPDLPVKAGDLYNTKTLQSQLTSFRGTARFRVTGPASAEPTSPGRVALTVPVTVRQ